MGKSYQLDTERFEDHDEITVTDSLDQAVSISSDQTVVVDNFYQAYQDANEVGTDQIQALFTRDGGICVVTRPWCLDWLLTQDDQPVTDEHFNQFEQVFCLEYHRRRDANAAVEASRSAADREVEFQKSSDLKSIEYGGYEFDADAINFTYNRTIAPGWVDELTLDASQSWLSATGVKNAFDEATSNFGLAETLNNVKDAATDILSSDSMPPLTASVGGGPLGIAGGILIWLVFRDGDLDSEEVFDALLDVDLTPEAREQLERANNLPPGTIETFCELATEDTLDAIAQLQEDTPEEMRADIQTIESQFGEIQETVKALEAQIRTYDEILDIERATDGIDTIEQSLEDDEATVLDLDHEEVNVAEIPYQAGDDGRDERKQLREAVDSGGLVLLRGPHGTGKTTAAFQTFRDLQQDGYNMQLPQFSEEFARSVYEYSLGDDTERTVLFNSFRIGTATVNDINHIGWLLDWLDDDVCQAVVIECRAEAYMSLNQQAGQRLSNEHKNDYWDEKTEISFDRFSSDAERSAYVEDICEWVLKQVGYDGDEETKIINEAVSFAEGNPEVAKIATRLAVSDSGMLSDSDIQTPDDLLWHDIERAVRDGKAGPLFNRLCGVREANTGQLNSLVDAEVSTLARLLVGYLGGEIRETVRRTDGDPNLFGDESWTVSPDIYAGTVFRREGIIGDDAAIGTYITDIAVNDREELYPNLAENLVIAHQYAQEWNQPQLQDAVEREANDFLRDIPRSDITPAEYCECIERLAFGGLPVEPTVIETNAELLRSGTTYRVTGTDADAPQLMTNYLSALWANHDPTTDVGAQDSYSSVFSTMAHFYEQSHDVDAEMLLMNVYSMTIIQLADRYADPTSDCTQAWLDHLQASATTAAQSDDHDEDASQFLENVYGTAIKHLAENYLDPTTDRTQAWLDQLQTRATTAAQSDHHDEDAGPFLKNVYTMAILTLADRYPDPTTDRTQAWLDQLQTRAATTAQSDHHDLDPGVFLENVYSIVIKNLAGTYLDSTTDRTQAWLNELQTRATTAAQSDVHDEDASQFLENVYSMAIKHLADSHPDPTTDRVQAWLDQLQTSATTAAQSDDQPHDAGLFLANVYSIAIKNLADAYPDPTTDRVQAWLGSIVIQIKKAARADAHSLSQDYFVCQTFPMAIGQVLKLPQQTAAQWYPALVARTVDGIDVDTIPQFCRARESIHEQDKRDVGTMHVQFSAAVLSAAIADTGQFGTDHEDRVARVSAVLAGTTDLIWKQTGLNDEYFRQLIATVEDVEQVAPSLYADIVDQTHNRLDETHDNLIASLDWQEAFR